MKSAIWRAAAPYSILLIGAAALYVVASRISYPARPGQLGPDFWPKLAIGLIVIVSVFEIAKAVLTGSAAEARGITDRLDQSGELEDNAPRRPVLLMGGIALTLAYGAVLGLLGFPLATFLFLVSFMYVGGYRSHAVIWLTNLAAVALLTLLFLKIVYVSLPRGVAPFDRITDFFVGLF